MRGKQANFRKTKWRFQKKGNIGTQKGGKCIQDVISIVDITRKSLDVSNCANYKHYFLPPISRDKIEINHFNEQIKMNILRKMTEWNQLDVSSRGPKPKVDKPLSQKLVCTFTRMNYLSCPEGIGYLKCEWVCAKSGEKDNLICTYYDNNMNYIFPVCKCQCLVLYCRHEEKRLAVQAKEEYMAGLYENYQTKLYIFVDS